MVVNHLNSLLVQVLEQVLEPDPPAATVLVVPLLILQAVQALSPLTLVLSPLLGPMLKVQVDMEESHPLVLTLSHLEAMAATQLEVMAATQQEVMVATLLEDTVVTPQVFMVASLLPVVNLFPAQSPKLQEHMVVNLQEGTEVNLLLDPTPNHQAATVVTLQEAKKISLLWPTVPNLQVVTMDKLLRVMEAKLLVASAASLPEPSHQATNLPVVIHQAAMAVNLPEAMVANLEVEATASQHTLRKNSTIKSLTARTTVAKIRQDSTHNRKAKALATVNSNREAVPDPVVMD